MSTLLRSSLSGYPVLCTFFRQKLTTSLLESADILVDTGRPLHINLCVCVCEVGGGGGVGEVGGVRRCLCVCVFMCVCVYVCVCVFVCTCVFHDACTPCSQNTPSMVE